jgi:hypothetical protein
MEYDTIAIMFMVIAVVACVLAITVFGVYSLNKIVDQNARESGSIR